MSVRFLVLALILAVWTIGCGRETPLPREQASAGLNKPIPPTGAVPSSQPRTTYFAPQLPPPRPPLAPEPRLVGPADAVLPAKPEASKAPAPSGPLSRPLVPLQTPAPRLSAQPEPRAEPMPAGLDPLVPPMEGRPPLLFGGQPAVIQPAAKEAAPQAQPVSPVAKPEPKTVIGPPAPAPKLDVPPLGAPKLPVDIASPAEKAPLPPAEKPPVGSTAPAASPRATLEKLSSGEPVLVVQAAWKELPRPSLQIALTDPKADMAKLEPIKLDGPQAQALWEKQVQAINKPVFGDGRQVLKTGTVFFECNGVQWVRIRSRVNALNHPAAYAVDDKTGTLLTIYLLDGWADDQGALRIALSDLDVATKFADAGRLKIWLLSEEKVVGSTTADWPGTLKPAVGGQPGGESKPGQAEAKPSTAKATSSAPPVKPEAKPAPAASPAPAVAASKPAVAPPAAVSSAPPPPKAPSDTAPAAPAATGPAPAPPAKTQAAPPPAETAKKDPRTMTIDELTAYIEKNYGDQMNYSVRRSWLGGMRNYYQSDNPESVRREVFMMLLRACWKEQRPGDLRNAFADLFQKFKQQEGVVGR